MTEYVLFISSYGENFAPMGRDFQSAGSFAEGAGGVAGFYIHVVSPLLSMIEHVSLYYALFGRIVAILVAHVPMLYARRREVGCEGSACFFGAWWGG
jgi:hypothetical protein